MVPEKQKSYPSEGNIAKRLEADLLKQKIKKEVLEGIVF